MQNKETKKTALALKQTSYWPLLVVTVIIVSLLIVLGFLFVKRVNTIVYKNAIIGQQVFDLELADTKEARVKGLSERDNLAPNKGMLFDFKENSNPQMHMLQMRFPIDIAWIDENYKIVYIKNNAVPAEYPDVYYAPTQSRFVIEVPAGTFEKLGVKQGDSVKIN